MKALVVGGVGKFLAQPSPGKRLILHIGSPKTGSSAIQNYFTNNSESFQRYGIYYPPHGLDVNGISGGHGRIGVEIDNENFSKARAIVDGFMSEADKKNCTLILSGEIFFTQPEGIFKVLEGLNVQIISFFRHPLEAFKSYYNQGVKRHYSPHPISFLAQHEGHRSQDGVTGKILLRWAELFGIDRVILIPYTELQSSSTDSPGEICTLLGLPYEKPAPRINHSYTPAAIEFKRIVNLILDRDQVRLNGKLDLILQAYSDQKLPVRPSLHDLLGNELFDELKAIYQPIVDEISELYSIDIPYSDETTSGSMYETVENVAQIVLGDEQLHSYLKIRTLDALREGNNAYEMYQLASWLRIPFRDISLTGGGAGLTQDELNSVLQPKASQADVLRELARLLERTGKYAQAHSVASKALKLRPDGEAIKKIVERTEIGVDGRRLLRSGGKQKRAHKRRLAQKALNARRLSSEKGRTGSQGNKQEVDENILRKRALK
ncbi:tetratricopeptide repeat protein [Oceanobacter mangrovi]|uniref:tetratricopeptide repeat protein n=1 Tax=Oceanobacter mangrovi TaxID=2862510 RepID=UPI001C8E3449|nr:tetratricopeptide repeat protein [Oceanobacter mangrovi]